MATNFSPCKGSYVLNQFPSKVMCGMNGFHVSASGAIQGHHGPLVPFPSVFKRLVTQGRQKVSCGNGLKVPIAANWKGVYLQNTVEPRYNKVR